MANTLLLIDCQQDFHPGGSLAIPTALDDAHRISTLIRENASKLHRIVATMDSHQKLHIAHPSFWWSSDGTRHPDPFTIISADDIQHGVWKPRTDLPLHGREIVTAVDSAYFEDIETIKDELGHFDVTKFAMEYARRLEARGRFQICIWPEHCLIGSPGHALVDSIREALDEWSEVTGRSVEWIFKGENILTEMYSALEADVAISKDTAFNDSFHTSLMQSDRLFVCGQAMSHCVNYTLRDVVAKWKVDETSRICLLTDCASAVPGFESSATKFVNDMKEQGVQTKVAAELHAMLDE